MSSSSWNAIPHSYQKNSSSTSIWLKEGHLSISRYNLFCNFYMLVTNREFVSGTCTGPQVAFTILHHFASSCSMLLQLRGQNRTVIAFSGFFLNIHEVYDKKPLRRARRSSPSNATSEVEDVAHSEIRKRNIQSVQSNCAWAALLLPLRPSVASIFFLRFGFQGKSMSFEMIWQAS